MLNPYWTSLVMMPRYREGFSTEPARTLYRQTILLDWFFREMLVLFLRSMECNLNIFSPISQKNLKQAAHTYGAAFALGGICASNIIFFRAFSVRFQNCLGRTSTQRHMICAHLCDLWRDCLRCTRWKVEIKSMIRIWAWCNNPLTVWMLLLKT